MKSRSPDCFPPPLRVALIILLALLPAFGCGPQKAAPTEGPKEVQLTEKGLACGSGVGLNAGDTLVLILEGNPTTGYTWEVGYFVPSVIRPAGEPEYQPASSLVGAGGTYTFRFLAVGEGQAALRLVYHRPWEKDTPDLKTCEVTVTVKGS